jgi:hypothetical protein
VVGAGRRAAAATAALYVLQGLPAALLLLLVRGGTDGDQESVFTVIPYWTGTAYLAGVVLFGLTLLVAPRLAGWSRRASAVTIVSATALYVLAGAAGIIAGSDSVDYAVYATLYMLMFFFLSGSVAFGCAVFWSWRTSLARRRSNSGSAG